MNDDDRKLIERLVAALEKIAAELTSFNSNVNRELKNLRSTGRGR